MFFGSKKTILAEKSAHSAMAQYVFWHGRCKSCPGKSEPTERRRRRFGVFASQNAQKSTQKRARKHHFCHQNALAGDGEMGSGSVPSGRPDGNWPRSFIRPLSEMPVFWPRAGPHVAPRLPPSCRRHGRPRTSPLQRSIFARRRSSMGVKIGILP